MAVSTAVDKHPMSVHQRNEQFIRMLPAIQRFAEFAFRMAPADVREELIQDAIAQAFGLFVRLSKKGKAELAYSTPLAKFAVRNVRAGRRMGSSFTSRDITSPCPSKARDFVIKRLDQFDRRRGDWREVLIEDHTAGPPQIAGARIDFSDWLRSFSQRKRSIACTLAAGESTGATARKFQMSAARISQLRVWFRENWERFQGNMATTQPSVAGVSCP
jgi:hypothetical protein